MQTKAQVTWLFIYCPCQAIAYTSGWRGSPAAGGVSQLCCLQLRRTVHASKKCAAALRRTGSMAISGMPGFVCLAVLIPMLLPEAARAVQAQPSKLFSHEVGFPASSDDMAVFPQMLQL